jgi:hypothetical protein
MTRMMVACLGLLMATPGLAQERAVRSDGGVLRALDRVNGHTQDMDLANGEAAEFGPLRVRLDECRVPAENPDGDAFAFVTIHETGRDERIFSGWMLASSPALNPLEHHRYDVWVLRCRT